MWENEGETSCLPFQFAPRYPFSTKLKAPTAELQNQSIMIAWASNQNSVYASDLLLGIWHLLPVWVRWPTREPFYCSVTHLEIGTGWGRLGCSPFECDTSPGPDEKQLSKVWGFLKPGKVFPCPAISRVPLIKNITVRFETKDLLLVRPMIHHSILGPSNHTVTCLLMNEFGHVS